MSCASGRDGRPHAGLGPTNHRNGTTSLIGEPGDKGGTQFFGIEKLPAAPWGARERHNNVSWRVSRNEIHGQKQSVVPANAIGRSGSTSVHPHVVPPSCQDLMWNCSKLQPEHGFSTWTTLRNLAQRKQVMTQQLPSRNKAIHRRRKPKTC